MKVRMLTSLVTFDFRLWETGAEIDVADDIGARLIETRQAELVVDAGETPASTTEQPEGDTSGAPAPAKRKRKAS